jgi:hypothetical protein
MECFPTGETNELERIQGQGVDRRLRHRPRGRVLDAGLVAALCRGDTDAFARLVDRHSTAMVRVAMAYVPSRAAAEEVVQETGSR